jgi:hypothetical protein
MARRLCTRVPGGSQREFPDATIPHTAANAAARTRDGANPA